MSYQKIVKRETEQLKMHEKDRTKNNKNARKTKPRKYTKKFKKVKSSKIKTNQYTNKKMKKSNTTARKKREEGGKKEKLCGKTRRAIKMPEKEASRSVPRYMDQVADFVDRPRLFKEVIQRANEAILYGGLTRWSNYM